MSTITLPVEETSLARLERLAEVRGTSLEKFLAKRVEAISHEEEPAPKSLNEAVAEARARFAAIPTAERDVISPRLRALVGILPPDFDAKKEYRAHIEQKYL